LEPSAGSRSLSPHSRDGAEGALAGDYETAVRFATQSRFDLAERYLRHALAEQPERAEAHALLAICLARLRRYREALAAANDGVRLNPTSAYSHYARAVARAAANKQNQALRDIEEAIRIDPTLA
jgi:tetratricopeptide (TPR) repeat protein